MSVCAIICEYNPLHRGHLWQIRQAKQRFDAVVCVMSGSFVQRGEPAIMDKFTRSRWALSAGADAVIELPAVYSLQSAEGFAAGGVRMAAALGATHLCFGSETEDTSLLTALAHLCLNEPDDVKQALASALSKGQSYPAAFQSAVQQSFPQYPDAAFLPNALLGVEYLKAIERYRLPLVPVTLPRRLPVSSSACRKALQQGQILEDVPAYVAHSLKQGPLVTPESLSPMLLYRLRMMSRAEFHALPFVSEGVENRLAQAAHTAVSLESLLSECRTKRYPLSRIKRLLCCALLHITQEDVRAANEQGPCYLHLLALNPQNAVMRSAVKAASLPVCTGGADLSSFPSFAMDARATDLYALCCGRAAGLDYTVPVCTSVSP